MKTISVERRKRGIFGWLIAIDFWGFNLMMAVWFITVSMLLYNHPTPPPQLAYDAAYHAGTMIGGAIAFSMILWFWFLAAVVLGILMLLTRGKKVTITTSN